MADKTATLEVHRFNPDLEEVARFERFTVRLEPRMTVLEALRQIKAEQDGSLTFRMSCRSGICGSCAMKINGFAKLACQTQVRGELERHKRLLVEPVGNFALIKDLVVDLEPFFTKVRAAEPWLVPAGEPSEGRSHVMTQEQVDQVGSFGNCILCASCYSECNSYTVDKGFIGPAACARAARYVTDSRDGRAIERARRLVHEEGLYWCTRCNYCSTTCPKQVRPAESFFSVKAAAHKPGVPKDPGARRSQGVYDDVWKIGRVNEATLALRALHWQAMCLTGMSLRMLIKGKFPNPFPERIEGTDQIIHIYRATEEGQ